MQKMKPCECRIQKPTEALERTMPWTWWCP